MISSDWSIVLAYLLGSVPFGLLLTRWCKGNDVRSQGSGNIGATNVSRTQGPILGFMTLGLDLGKGALAVALAPPPLRGWAAVAAVVGHCFPIWLKFRGGKGVATAFGAFLLMAPLMALCSLGVFIVVIALTRWVSLGSTSAAMAFPGFLFLWSHPSSLWKPALVVGAIILWRHRGNLDRLSHGREPKFGEAP